MQYKATSTNVTLTVLRLRVRSRRIARSKHTLSHNPPSRRKAFCRKAFIIIIFKPTSTKPQAGKLGLTYKIMVATAIYSVAMVLRKETAFPLRRAMERRWKRNVVSLVSSVIVVIGLPISLVSSMAISCHVPAVSMANG